MKTVSKPTSVRRRSNVESLALPTDQSVVVPADFPDRVARQLAKPLQQALARRTNLQQRASDVLELVRRSLERELDQTARHPSQLASQPRQGSHAPAPSETLPLDELSTAQVLQQRLVDLSQASLYRAVRERRFYCVRPRGRSNGRLFPAWQFAGLVPELLRPVLEELGDQPATGAHAFFVSALDEFNELAPAELLAGLPFASRPALHPSQQRLLALPPAQRLARVQTAARRYRKGLDFVG